MKFFFTFLTVLVTFIGISACNNSPVLWTDGDTDGAPDGDLDISPVDGDTDTHDADREADEEPDGDGNESDADIMDADVIDGDLIDRDIDADPEPEGDEAEQEFQQYMENFPFETTTVVPCSNSRKSFRPLNVWGDSLGNVYFAGQSSPEDGVAPFWVYDQTTDTFTCDTAVTETIHAIDGRIVGGDAELWLAATDKIGRLYQGTWTWVTIAAPETIVSEGMPILGLRVSSNGVVAVWGDLGLAFYNPTTQAWMTLELCADRSILVLQAIIGLSGYWINDLFYLPIGCSTYRINPENPACDVFATLAGCEIDESFQSPILHATGAVGETLWLGYSSIGDGIRELFTVDVNTGASFEPIGFSADHCADAWESESVYNRIVTQTRAPSGTAGTPIVFTVSSASTGSPSCGSNVYVKVSTNAERISCDLPKPLFSGYANCGRAYQAIIWRDQNSSVWAIMPDIDTFSTIARITWTMP